MTANTDSAARVGTVLVADQVVTVTQNPAAGSPSTCVFDVDPLGVSAPASGGTPAIAVVPSSNYGPELCMDGDITVVVHLLRTLLPALVPVT
jgi:hypothetical protein